jgi:hypothetical protein
MKQMGARNAGNPHVACDVEGAGDVERSRYLGLPARQFSTLPMSGEGRRTARGTAPLLGSTVFCGSIFLSYCRHRLAKSFRLPPYPCSTPCCRPCAAIPPLTDGMTQDG